MIDEVFAHTCKNMQKKKRHDSMDGIMLRSVIKIDYYLNFIAIQPFLV